MLRGLLRGGALARGGGALARGLRRPPLLHAAPPLHAAPSRGFRATPVGALASDLYERLGVARDASASEIKKSYYQTAKKYHPDTNQGDPAAAKKFAEATEAYETLTDPAKRQMYDQYGHVENGAGGGGGGGGGRGGPFGRGGFEFRGGAAMDHEEILRQFESLFGGGGMGRGSRRGRDVQVQLTLELMEAVKGCKKTVAWRSPKLGHRSTEIDIPAGVDSGMNLRVNGEGEPGQAGPGTLFIAIAVREHDVFERDGFDLHVRVRLTLAEAVLGTRVSIPTLDGHASLKVPPGTQHGDRRVMQGRGVRAPDGSGTGHQFIHFEVRIPRALSPSQRQLIETYGEGEEEMDEDERTRRNAGRR